MRSGLVQDLQRAMERGDGDVRGVENPEMQEGPLGQLWDGDLKVVHQPGQARRVDLRGKVELKGGGFEQVDRARGILKRVRLLRRSGRRGGDAVLQKAQRRAHGDSQCHAAAATIQRGRVMRRFVSIVLGLTI